MRNNTYRQGTGYTPVSPRTTIPFEVFIPEDVMHRLNEYARAALPTEIGGLARIEPCNDRDVMVTDFRMLPQTATGATFSINADMVAEFLAELVAEDKLEEVEQWCSIVHTHPVGMGPGMSGVDVDNILEMADDGHFFSLILGASHQADSTRIAMHYAQATPYGDTVILSNLPVKVCKSETSNDELDAAQAAFDAALAELNRVRTTSHDQVRAEIEADVPTIIEKKSLAVRNSRAGAGFSINPQQYEREKQDEAWLRYLEHRDYEKAMGDLDDDDNVEYSWDWWRDRDEAELKSVLEMTDEEFVKHMKDEHEIDHDEAISILAGVKDEAIKS
jgi:hypothetical protein